MRSVATGSFERLSSFEALWRAFETYRQGKRRRPRVAAFDLDADREILQLRRALTSGSYRPGRFDVRLIRDPKLRLIASQPILDCVLQQALIDDIGPTYERSYIDHSFACGTGRGPQRAVLCHLGWMRRYRYRLALDIRRYFLSIHRPTLCRLIHRRLRDAKTRDLITLLVESGAEIYTRPVAVKALKLETEPLPPESGLPIGSYLSQWSGSLYLDGLDHFVKRHLKIPAYLRYMDDFVLFSNDAAELKAARTAISDWLERERRLQLNLKKWHIAGTRQPCVFLGYRVNRSGILPSRKMKRRMQKRLRSLAKSGNTGRLRRSLTSYRGLMLFG